MTSFKARQAPQRHHGQCEYSVPDTNEQAARVRAGAHALRRDANGAQVRGSNVMVRPDSHAYVAYSHERVTQRARHNCCM
jgi:hypothetical protein